MSLSSAEREPEGEGGGEGLHKLSVYYSWCSLLLTSPFGADAPDVSGDDERHGAEEEGEEEGNLEAVARVQGQGRQEEDEHHQTSNRQTGA